MSRASNMFCYDPVIFFYLLTVLGGIVRITLNPKP